jgi:hypothetical protein
VAKKRRRNQGYYLLSDETYADDKRTFVNSRVAVNSIKEAESKKKIELMDAQVFNGLFQKYLF